MSPAEIWCNEAQERYVLAIPPGRLAEFSAMCERERCPFAVVGVTTGETRLVVSDSHFGNEPVNMDMDALLGKPPRMTRDVDRLPPLPVPFDATAVDLKEAAYRVLRLPAVADKSFLITIGDRSVGGLTARDQMVGPWQVPVCRRRGDPDVVSRLSRRSLRDRRARAAGGDRRARFGPHGRRRSADQPRRRRHRDARRRQAVRQLDGRRRLPRRGCPPVRHRAGGFRSSASRSVSRSRSARIRCRCAPAWRKRRRQRRKQVVSPLSLIVTGFARGAAMRAGR
jgi:hypothetical protein